MACPECDEQIALKPTSRAQGLKCPACGAQVLKAETKLRQRGEDDEDADETESKPKKKPRKRREDDDDDYDHDHPRARRPHRRNRGTQPAVSLPVILTLAFSGLMVVLAFVIRDSAFPLMCVAFGMVIIGSVWVRILALMDGSGQFLLCMFVPFYVVFYVFTNFDRTKWPLSLSILGLFVMVGCLIAGIARESISKDNPSPAANTAPGSNWQGSTDTSAAENALPAITPPFAVDPLLEQPVRAVYLADMKEFGVRMGPWPLGKGELGNGPHPALQIRGERAFKGLGVSPWDKAATRVAYALGGKATTLSGRVALNDCDVETYAPVVFKIVGDGRELWKSGPTTQSGGPTAFKVDVRGVKVLELRHRAGCPQRGTRHVGGSVVGAVDGSQSLVLRRG
jgi:hypothetical protein